MTLGGYLSPGKAGASLDLTARLSPSWAAFARGQLGLVQDNAGAWRPDAQALVGVGASW